MCIHTFNTRACTYMHIHRHLYTCLGNIISFTTSILFLYILLHIYTYKQAYIHNVFVWFCLFLNDKCIELYRSYYMICFFLINIACEIHSVITYSCCYYSLCCDILFMPTCQFCLLYINKYLHGFNLGF